jgi:CMP-N-acetylneuraminic acid synthetase
MVTVLGIIPARGGSKGVPGKNIRMLAGQPLIAWTIMAAQQCTMLNRVIVSTDDEQIKSVAQDFGAEVPFLRPPEYAQDTSLDMEVYLHAIHWLQNNENFIPDIVVWLRPTSPLRTHLDIDAAVTLLLEKDAPVVRAVCPVEHHPYWMKRLENERLAPIFQGISEYDYPQRQLLPPVYRITGAIDITRTANTLQSDTLYGQDIYAYVMPSERSIDIDNELDFVIAEYLMKEKTNG